MNNVNTIGINVIKYIFLFGFLMSVFVFWNNAEVTHEIPKVWFSLRWIEVLGVVVFIGLNKIRKERIDGWLLLCVFSFLAVVITASVLGSDLNRSIAGNYYRLDGITTLLHLIILFFIVVLFSKKDWVTDFTSAASFASVILGLISVVQFIGNLSGLGIVETWDNGYGHVFGNPNFLAGFLIVTLPLTAYKLKTTNRVRWALGLVFHIAGIILTFAWVGIFGILLFMGIWLFIEFKKIRAIVLVSGLLLFIGLTSEFIKYEKSLETPVSINPESRERIIMKGLLAFSEKPLLGYGWANFDKAFQSVDYPIQMNQDVYVDKAHSSLLEVLTTTGIIGFLVYVLLILRILQNLWNQSSNYIYRYLLLSFLLLLLHMQTNVVSISEEILFWVFAGFSAKDLG